MPIGAWHSDCSTIRTARYPRPTCRSGLAAIQAAKATGAKTQRERDYIDALAVMYVDYDKTPHGARVQSYLKAMEALAAKYPDDDEAQIFYAITLNVAASPTDKTYANQLKGAAILEVINKRQPRHPGVAHYLIHLYDSPALADKGIDAARRYSKIAPAAPHAQHMPSHIFTRVGLWNDSVAANIASVQAAKADKSPGDQMHGEDYLVYAYLQLDQDKNARASSTIWLPVLSVRRHSAAHFALAASPARYVVERGDWKGAAQLQVSPERISPRHGDHAISPARSALRARAIPTMPKRTSPSWRELHDKLVQAKVGYWPEIVDIQRQIATAWMLYADGKYDDALKAMSAAADAEDKTEKSPVTPGQLMPARELYGYMLLERGHGQGGAGGIRGDLGEGAQPLQYLCRCSEGRSSARRQGKAKAYYQELIALASAGDNDRPVLAEAKAFVASN